MFYLIKKGKVKSFNEMYTNDVSSWSCNPKCRSFRITNEGDTPVKVVNNGSSENLLPNQSITYGGYTYCYRSEDLSFKFDTIITSKKISITQDIEVKPPVFIKSDIENIDM